MAEFFSMEVILSIWLLTVLTRQNLGHSRQKPLPCGNKGQEFKIWDCPRSSGTVGTVQQAQHTVSNCILMCEY